MNRMLILIAVALISVFVATYINRENIAKERFNICASRLSDSPNPHLLCRCYIDNTVYRHPIKYYTPLIKRYFRNERLISSIHENALRICIHKS